MSLVGVLDRRAQQTSERIICMTLRLVWSLVRVTLAALTIVALVSSSDKTLNDSEFLDRIAIRHVQTAPL